MEAKQSTVSATSFSEPGTMIIFGVGASKTDHREDAAVNSRVPGKYMEALSERNGFNCEMAVTALGQIDSPRVRVITNRLTVAITFDLSEYIAAKSRKVTRA